jgi:hypothetical protein
MTVTPFDYSELLADADELIEEFGRTVSVRHATSSGTGLEPTVSATDYATKGVREEFTLKQIQSGNVQQNDQRWLVAAGPLAALGVTSIAKPDALVIGGVAIPVLVAKPIQPAETVVYFDCHCRV